MSSAPNVHDQGRGLLAALYAASRSLKFYPVENEAVQRAIDELHGIVKRILVTDGGLELRVVGEFFFLNETRLRLDLSNFATFANFARTLLDRGIGAIEVLPGLSRAEWAPFLSLLLHDPDPDDPYGEFVDRLDRTPVIHVEIRPESEVAEEEKEEAMTAAKRMYVQTVKVARDALEDVRLGRAVNVRKVKRAVQSIVDQVLSNEPSILTMTTLRDFDEYTFTHCVNVCIFSLIIGQRIGLDRMQLYELGLGALLHDIGKMRVDRDIINKPGDLEPEEWTALKEHPAEGLLLLFGMAGFADVPYRPMLMAYEHHMKVDGTGYPTSERPRTPSLFSRIVAVADGFDAGSSVRSYQYRPWPPDQVLSEMRDNPRRGYDPLLVKVLISATGVFPVGTLVVLDSFELAVVAEVNPDPDLLHLPVVMVISDAMALPLTEPLRIDLSRPETAPDGSPRRIVKTTDAEKYGINVADILT